MGETAVRRRVVVHGRVQGVSYRASCAEVARRAGVGGWVGNEPDGTVVAELEGTPTDVDAVVAWCHDGPPGAGVERVDVTDVEPSGATGFEVR